MMFWPKTLVGRTVMVVLAGLVVSNLIGLAVYTTERLELVTGSRAAVLADVIANAVQVAEETPWRERRRLVRRMASPGVRLFWARRLFVETEDEDWQARLFRRALEEALAPVLQVDAADDGIGARLRLSHRSLGAGGRAKGGAPPLPQFTEPGFHGGPRADNGPGPPPGPGRGWGAGLRDSGLTLELLAGAVELSDGSWLHFALPLGVDQPFWQTRHFIAGLASTAIALAVTVWAVRRAARPLTTLARAAETLGLDMDADPLRVDGPEEVRSASSAFNTMQSRLQRFVRDRTNMLAAISHDLRTPITRMRLRAEFVEDEVQRAKMLSDLNDMEAMIAATLQFAKGDATREHLQLVDVAALLQTVCADASDAGGDVRYTGPDRIICRARPLALKRAFVNVVDNALTYGGVARVDASIRETPGRDERGQTIVVTVDDDGPGLPEADLERVFEPFVRSDDSRSRDTGGVGLGLAVVRAATMAHGGEIMLSNRDGGGLRATITLPCRRTEPAMRGSGAASI